MNPTLKRSNENSKRLNLKEIAKLVGGELVGDTGVAITGVAGIREAKKGDISFISNAKYLPYLEESNASAVITFTDVVSSTKPLVRIANPSQAFTKVLSVFKPDQTRRPVGIHPSAVIAKNVVLGRDVSIGPGVVLDEKVRIGDRTVIEANSFIGVACLVGEDARIYPNVTVREETRIGDRTIIHSGTVIGSDGFGYDTVDEKHHKIPHLGNVVIEEDVEIGANVCVDRGRFQETRIKKGSKIDNLVQIAHNVVIGENCLVVSQSGLSGSVVLGNNVVIAGQAGVVGHVTLGDGTVVGARSGVTKSVPPNSVVLGGPAKPIAEQKRIIAAISRLPEFLREFSEFKKQQRLPARSAGGLRPPSADSQ